MNKNNIVLALALLVSACGSDTNNDIAEDIQNGKLTSALETITTRLKVDPTDPTLHALAIKTRVELCIKNNCFAGDTSIIEPIATSLPLTPNKPINLGEQGVLDIHKYLKSATHKILALPNQPKPMLTMAKILAGTPAQPEYIAGVFKATSKIILTLDNTEAKNALTQIATSKFLNKTQTQYSNLLLGMVTGNRNWQRDNTIGLRNVKTASHLPPQAMGSLIAAAYLQQHNVQNEDAATWLVDAFPAFLEELKIPQFITPQARTVMANTLARMRQNPTVKADMLQQSLSIKQFLDKNITAKPAPKAEPEKDIKPIKTPAVESAEITPPPPSPLEKALNLYLDRLSLILNPSQKTLWKTYLPKAKNYVIKTKDTNLLGNGVPSELIPAETQAEYTATLVEIMENLGNTGTNIIPFLKQLSIKENDKKTRVKVEKIIQLALTKSLETKQLDTVIAYTRFNPEIARQKRQLVLPAFIEALKTAFKADDFDSVKKYGEYLIKDVAVEFNLDSILLKEFDSYLNNIKISESLNSNSLEFLLKPQTEININLGPKFQFLQNYFKESPEILDSVLKNLVLNSIGQYGTPTALYRLFPSFNNTSFPLKERETYLISSIKSSLSNDANLSALKIAQAGLTLNKLHPNLELNFVINETLNRIKNLENGRKVWAFIPTSMKKAMQAIRPEFAALMKAVNAFDSQNFAQAANLLATLHSPYYLAQAEPFINYYLETLTKYKGVYAPQNLANTHLPLVTIAIKIANKPNGQTTGKSLMEAKLELTTRIGTFKQTSEKNLSSTQGKTYNITIPSKLDFSQLRLTPIIPASLPENIPAKFTDIFGDIKYIDFKNPKQPLLVVHTQNNGTNKQTIYQQIATATNQPILPNGRFVIKQQLSKPNPNTNDIMPAGSIIELTVDTENLIEPTENGKSLGVIFPITGLMWHPANPKNPQEVTGFYNPTLQTTNLAFEYPATGSTNSNIEAVARCNILAGQIVCGAHNRHNLRNKYSHIVSGIQTVESYRKMKTTSQALQKFMEYAAKKSAPKPVVIKTEAKPLSPTTVISPTTPKKETPKEPSPTDILPPPKFK